MIRVEQLKQWAESNRDIWIDLVRMYLGVGLVIKGVLFIGHASLLLQSMEQANFIWGVGLIAHYVIAVHVFGGALLFLGLLTRGAAVANIPVLLGAVFVVHRQEGLFTSAQTLEFAILVLFLLCVLAVSGGGRLSLDHYVAKYAGDGDQVRTPRPAPIS